MDNQSQKEAKSPDIPIYERDFECTVRKIIPLYRKVKILKDEHQTRMLRDYYDTEPQPNSVVLDRIAIALNLTCKQVKDWFRNHRHRMAKKKGNAMMYYYKKGKFMRADEIMWEVDSSDDLISSKEADLIDTGHDDTQRLEQQHTEEGGGGSGRDGDEDKVSQAAIKEEAAEDESAMETPKSTKVWGSVTGKSLKLVDFQIVVQLNLVLICRQISCTTIIKSTNLRLLPVTGGDSHH